jgi:outer membrane protein assembly factor BamB
MHTIATSAWGEVTLSWCQAPPPETVVTTAAPVREHPSLYVALSSEDGAVLWHQPLGSGPGVSYTFDTPPVVQGGAVYVARIDNRGRGVLFALDTRDGAECWHTAYPSALAAALAQ